MLNKRNEKQKPILKYKEHIYSTRIRNKIEEINFFLYPKLHG